MTNLLDILHGGDRRSIGRSDEVVEMVKNDLSRFSELIPGLEHSEAVVRMRSADAIEKITVYHPNLLVPYVLKILSLASECDQIEGMWHFAQIIPRLPLSDEHLESINTIFSRYMKSKSAIVRTFTLQAYYDLTLIYPGMKEEVVQLLQSSLEDSSKAVRTRCRNLLDSMQYIII